MSFHENNPQYVYVQKYLHLRKIEIQQIEICVPFPSGACLMRKVKVIAKLARRWSPSDFTETAFLHCICYSFVYICILFLK